MHAMKIHQPFKKIIEYNAFSVKLPTIDLVLRLGQQNRSLLIEKTAGFVKCIETSPGTIRRSEDKDLLQPSLFGFKHIYCYNAEGTTIPDHPCLFPRAPPTSPWPSALGWGSGMDPGCQDLPSPTQGAPNTNSPRVAQTVLVDENWGKNYF